MSLQQRLAEESPIMSAAEGLTPEQRLLVRERELTAQIDALTAERKELRESLLAHYQETGEAVGTDAYELSPKRVEVHEYDVRGMLAEFSEWPGLFTVDGTGVTKGLQCGLLDKAKIDALRTTKTRIDFGVKAVKR